MNDPVMTRRAWMTAVARTFGTGAALSALLPLASHASPTPHAAAAAAPASSLHARTMRQCWSRALVGEPGVGQGPFDYSLFTNELDCELQTAN